MNFEAVAPLDPVYTVHALGGKWEASAVMSVP